MPDRWVVDQEHPDGYLVPMTVEEEAQHTADTEAGEARALLEATVETNDRTIRDRLEAALANWPSLTANQKDAVLKGLVRLALRRLENAG